MHTPLFLSHTCPNNVLNTHWHSHVHTHTHTQSKQEKVGQVGYSEGVWSFPSFMGLSGLQWWKPVWAQLVQRRVIVDPELQVLQKPQQSLQTSVPSFRFRFFSSCEFDSLVFFRSGDESLFMLDCGAWWVTTGLASSGGSFSFQFGFLRLLVHQ